MCLDRVTNGKSRMKPEIIGYQIKWKENDCYEDIHIGVRPVNRYRIGVGYKADAPWVYVNEDRRWPLKRGRQKEYRAGFHVFEKISEASYYRSIIVGESVILKVKASEPICRGIQRGVPVLVYNKIKYLEEI